MRKHHFPAVLLEALILIPLALEPGAARASGFMVSKMGGDLSGPTEPNGAATFWNPAATGAIGGSSVFLDATWIWREASFQRDWAAGFDPGARKSDPGRLSTFAVMPMAAATWTLPRHDWITLGFGFYVPYGNRSDWPAFDLAAERAKDPLDQAAPAQAYQALSGHLETYFFTPTLALRLTEGVYFGAGVSWIHTELALTRLLDVGSGIFPPETLASSALSALDFSGDDPGWSVGLLLFLADGLRVGLSFTAGTRLDLDGRARVTLPPLFAPAGGPDSVESTARMELRLPAALRAGIHVDVTEWLVLRLNLEYVAWSEFSGIRVHELAFPDIGGLAGSVLAQQKDFESRRQYRDTLDVRFGARVFPVPWWMIFGGVGLDQNAIPDEAQGADIFDSLKIGLAVGSRLDVQGLLEAFSLAGPALPRLYLTVGINGIFFLENQVRGNALESPLDGTYRSRVLLLSTSLETRY